MRFQTIAFSVCAVIAYVAASPTPNPISANTPPPSPTRFTTNAERLNAGLPPLKPTKREHEARAPKPSKRASDAAPASASIETRFIPNAERIKRGVALFKPTKRQGYDILAKPSKVPGQAKRAAALPTQASAVEPRFVTNAERLRRGLPLLKPAKPAKRQIVGGRPSITRTATLPTQTI